MTWSLAREWGINAGINTGSSPDRGRGRQANALCHPTRAFRAADGTYLISEERGTDKLVPFRFECRTIRVAPDHSVLFDSVECGIDDGFGCLLSNGQIALVRRTCWELLVLSEHGTVLNRIQLERFSKRIPRYATWTHRGTFLVVFYNRSFEVDIVEIDRQGRLLWFLPATAPSLGIPGSVELLPSDHLLIADSFRHVMVELDRAGQLIWQHGVIACPSDESEHLSSPNSARRYLNGNILISDTRNHRILELDPHGNRRCHPPCDRELCDPSYAEPLGNGHLLICDTGNARVIEVDAEGKIVWQIGRRVGTHRPWSYPRSIDVALDGSYLVADTGQNRVVRIRDDQNQAVEMQSGGSLFWPRCVRALPDGGLLIADARNKRIVDVSAEGFERRSVAVLHGPGPSGLEDPHDVQSLPNDRLLITDSSQDMILEIDWSGQIHRTIGGRDSLRLKDPHSAQELPDGSVVISDTGNHRLIFVSHENHCLRTLYALSGDGYFCKLHHPRYAEVSRDGTLIVADTGNNRVLGASLEGHLRWEFSHVPSSNPDHLNQPRWATMINSRELLVCDHFHHRILHVVREETDRL